MEESSPGIIWRVLSWHLLEVYDETPLKIFVRTAAFPTWNGTFCIWSRSVKLSTLALRACFWILLLRKQGSKFVVVSIPISYWEGRGSKIGPETSHTVRHFRRLWSSTWCCELRYRGFWKNLLLEIFKYLFRLCTIQSLSLTVSYLRRQ